MVRRSLFAMVALMSLLVAALAGPAAADEHDELPEGFTAEQCGVAVAFEVYSSGLATIDDWVEAGLIELVTEDGELLDILIVEGQEQNFLDEVVEFLEGIDLTLAEACTFYGANVGGFVLGHELIDPAGVCDTSAPFLEFRTTVDAQTVTLTWVEITDADDADFSGEDQDGNPVSGVVRYTHDDVALEDDNGTFVARMLWPGAGLDDDGDVETWPGFKPRFDNGTIVGWDPSDDGYEWARADAEGQLGVFAVLEDADLEDGDVTTDLFYVTYAPPDETCEIAVDEARVLPQVLSRTGTDTGLLIAFAGGLLALGVLALWRGRRRQVAS